MKKPMTITEMARLGGLARSKAMSADRRSEIASKAGKARWQKKNNDGIKKIIADNS